MYLKSLEMQGFKSFPDRIKLTFDKGLTAVVGPNGSGKSNISDAVRWVLGEQSTKTLRGAKMEDVIFSGTQTRKSMGYAQVTLTIDNAEHVLPLDSSEVAITRKLYKSGESEYLLNGSAVRLKDVRELLMDTGMGRDGYSIVGQGKIAEIVSAKSNERREIFEEAAGISKFRYKKEEAERRLASAQENILRLKDIIGELEGRIGPLRQQSEKAQAFIKLAEQRRTAEVSVGVKRLDELKLALKEHEDKLLQSEGEYEQLDADMERLEEQVQKHYADMQACLVDIEAVREKSTEQERQNAAASSDIAVLENEMKHNSQSIDRIAERKKTATLSFADLDRQMADKQQFIAAKQTDGIALEQQSTDIKEQFASLAMQSEDSVREHDTLSTKLTQLSLQQSEQRLAIAGADTNREQAAGRLGTMQQQREQLLTILDELAAEQAEFAKSAASLASEELEHQNRQSGYTRLYEGKAAKLTAAKQEYERLNSTLREKEQRMQLLSDVEKNMEGYPHSVKQVLSSVKSGRLRGIHGTIAQLISAPDKYSLAIEIALGAAMQNLVVDNEEIAKRAIYFLKEQNAGRATFLPITSVHGNVLDERDLSSDRMDGYYGAAYSLVQYDKQYDGIIKSLLGRIAVVDDIDTATALAKRYGYKFRIVTLDGQVINAGGSFTGGSVGKSAGVLTRKNEIDALGLQVSELSGKQQAAKAALSTLQAEVDKLSIELEAQRDQAAQIAQDKIRFEAEERRIGDLLLQRQEQCAGVDTQMEHLREQIAESEQVAATAAKKLELITAELTEAENALALSAGMKNDMQQQRERLSAALSDMRLKQMELAKDIEVAQGQLIALESAKVDLQSNAATLDDEIAELEASSEEHRRRIAEQKLVIADGIAAINQFEEEIKRLMKAREAHERGITELRASIKTMTEARERFSREVARLTERKLSVQRDYDAIISDLWEQYQLTKSEADKVAQPVEDMLTAQKELNELRSKMKALGSVNVAAIDEYKEVSERYEFLSKQLSDVENSKGQLERLIDELTDSIQERFSNSFTEINRNFGRIFTELFGGGKAELVLTDPDNVLESGIEINVAPPGKIIKNLASLSGGEQAFVAIAIYFAILKVRPAPFCILDEIEAALDDVNVAKYAAYLRNFSQHTQFILITHRRGTMEAADILYGVTMQENGISKLLQMQVGDSTYDKE